MLALVLDTVLLAGLLTSAAALGDILLRRSHLAFDSSLERLLVALGLGHAVLAYAVVALAAIGQLYPLPAWILFATGLVVAATRIRYFTPRPITPLTRLEMFQSAQLLVFALIYLIIVLAPPTDWDAQMYHLEAPKRYIQAHGYVYIPNAYTNFPQFGESLYAFALLIGDDILARLLNLALGSLAILTIYVIARRFVKRDWALLAALLFASSPVVGIAFTDVFVESTVTFYGLCTMLALLKWRASGDQRWLWLGAALTGICLAIKYYSLILVPILAWALLERAWRHDRRPIQEVVRLLVTAMLLALIFPLPWLIKNTIFVGDPVFPVISGLLGRWGRGLAEANSHLYGMGYRPLDYLLLPWRMTFSDRFGEIRPGLLFLALLPLLVGVSRTPRPVRWMAGVILLWFVFWANSAGQSMRFFLTGLALLSIVFVVAADRLSLQFRWLPRVLLVLITAGILHNLSLGPIHPVPHAYQALPAVTGQQTRHEFLTDNLDIYPLADFANRNLSPSAQVATVWEERSYYFDRPLIIGLSPDGAFVHRFVVGDDPAALAGALLSRGITHLIINDNIATWYEFQLQDRYVYGVETSSLLAYAPAFRACFLRPLFDHKGITLYEILSESGCPIR